MSRSCRAVPGRARSSVYPRGGRRLASVTELPAAVACEARRGEAARWSRLFDRGVAVTLSLAGGPTAAEGQRTRRAGVHESFALGRGMSGGLCRLCCEGGGSQQMPHSAPLERVTSVSCVWVDAGASGQQTWTTVAVATYLVCGI